MQKEMMIVDPRTEAGRSALAEYATPACAA